jgi:hypothetical protein
MRWEIPAILAIAIAVYVFFQSKKEPFELEENATHGIFYKENPCGGYADCRSCAAAAGCGWCADASRCAPMGQDGFPIRYKADTGARLPVCAPYGFIVEAPKCFD